MNIDMEENEIGLIMLIQQYSMKFGMTFSSKLVDDAEKKAKLMQLMAEAISGKRGAISDEDVI